MNLWIGWSVGTFFGVLVGWELRGIWAKHQLRQQVKIHPDSILGKMQKLQLELGTAILDALTKKVE